MSLLICVILFVMALIEILEGPPDGPVDGSVIFQSILKLGVPPVIIDLLLNCCLYLFEPPLAGGEVEPD